VRSCLVSVGAAAILLAAAAAPASAKDGLDLSFHFTGSDGYRVTLGGYGTTAFVNVTRPAHAHPRKAEWSTYITRGKVSSTAIDADFGNLGSVAMHFQPSGETVLGKRHQGCVGRDRYTIRPGAFVGSVRFRGEGGYVSANVHRVKGKEITPRQLFCRDIFEQVRGGRAHAKGRRSKVTRFQAYMRSGLTATAFNATETHGKAVFFAEIEQSIGSVGVFRGVLVHASPATFAFDSALSFAGVTPPAPFSGSASFQHGPGGRKEWTGSLAVSFPGAPDVPLTGSEFRTQLSGSW
jgi:hypothetical protein